MPEPAINAINGDGSAVLVAPAANSVKSLRSHQVVTVALLFVGYAAYYFCRSDLSVAMPLLIDDLGRHGVPASQAVVRLGAISSFGVLAYAVGKLLLTGFGDIWGGKRAFAVGLGGAIAFTLLFASAGALPIFTIAWIGNRLTQSIGWAGLIKVCSKWFGYSFYGTVAGILSLSFLVGDAAARQWMGALIQHGYGWRALFYFAAAVAGVVLLANVLFLRESRSELGYPEAEVNPLNVFAGSSAKPHSFWTLLKPLLFNRAFVFVCLLSLGTTVVRETFNIWTPVYLRNFFGYTAGSAASTSAIFPAVGAVSVVVSGWLSDRLGVTGRSIIMFFGLAATAAALTVLTSLRAGSPDSVLPLILIGAIAFCLLGPYSYLAGAFALDFGGREGGASSSGLIDGVGYLGGVLAGDTVARLSVAFGWRGVFVALAIVSALSALAAGYLFVYQRRQARSGSSIQEVGP